MKTTSPRAAKTQRRKGPVKSLKGSSGALTKEIIIAAALEEIDEHGLHDFSIRNVAKKLNVFPTAITWHVKNRNLLLAHVVSVTLADILPPGFPVSWQGFLRELFHRFREAIRRHPNVAPLIGTQLVGNPAVDLVFVETLLATLQHAGFRGMQLVASYNTLLAALVGFTTQEFASLPHDEIEVWQGRVQEHLKSASALAYPILVKNIELLSNRAFMTRWLNGVEAPFDDTFEMFVDIVITGLEHVKKSR
jgi:AcrR family transcriptional regulator